MKRTLVWDGEKIKEVVTQEERKHSAKEVLEAIDNNRGRISQAENTAAQLKQQTQQNEADLKNLKELDKELSEFEEKCVDLQKSKLLSTIKLLHSECVEKAEKDAKATIAKDPNAYNEMQKDNLPYLNYQKLLATHEKVREKFARRIISKYLYDEPIFENPFKPVEYDI